MEPSGGKMPVNLPSQGASEQVTPSVVALTWTSFRRRELDATYARASSGLPVYQFEVAVVASANVLERIKKVTYNIPGWPAESSPRTVMNREEKFKIKDVAWGSPFVNARLEIDGQVDPVELSCVIPLLEKGPRL